MALSIYTAAVAASGAAQCRGNRLMLYPLLIPLLIFAVAVALFIAEHRAYCKQMRQRKPACPRCGQTGGVCPGA